MTDFRGQWLICDFGKELAATLRLIERKGGKVHIALYNGRDSFELKGVKLDSVDNVRQKFRGELKYLTDVMEELLRNDRF